MMNLHRHALPAEVEDTIIGLIILLVSGLIFGPILFRAIAGYRPWWRFWTCIRDIKERYRC